jgi:two-component system chemotaxis sensor kinase CheA
VSNDDVPLTALSEGTREQEEQRMPPPEEDPIVAEFIIEAREHLSDVENQLLAIEASGADIDVELVNTVFRAVHSIKGAAGFLGFTGVCRLAHTLENVLNLIRNQELVPVSANTDVMLRAADTLRAMVDDIHQSSYVDISNHVAELQQIADDVSGENETASTASAEREPTVLGSTGPTEPSELAHGAQDTAATTAPEAHRPDASLVQADEPSVPPETVIEDEVSPHSSKGPVVSDAASPQPSDSTKPELRTRSGPSTSADTSIRVSVHLLDRLMNLAGELVLSRNQLVQQVGSDGTAELDSVAGRVDQVTSELQEAIMQTRMQVIGTVFGKFPRVVRDLSNQLGKQCQLTLEGEDVELDKSIIEAIGDPLTHLVRNSVDHGIESPEQRIAAGKPAAGAIVLRAFHQAGKVNISISDDGGGIDVAKLKEKAIGRGLITPEQASDMSDREALRLIFHPGFSMAEAVTGVSGRGVGMDVVKTNIEKLGGAVGIDTRTGAGTTIHVKLPLTLAIIPSLIVRCRGDRFAIPQASINELVRLKAADVESRIERINDAEVFRLRGNLLPLVRLDGAVDVREKAESTGDEPVNIIVVETGQLQYGLVVDGLHDSEEIVVKPLGRHMQNCHCLAGATILGDGESR